MRKNMPELRVLGTSVTLTEAMRRRAEQDLGLRIRFEVLDGFDAQRQAVMRQDSFDLYDQWFHSLDCLWPTGALKPIDIGRLAHWDEVNALPKTGRITPQAALGAGCNPAMRLYVQADGTLGGTPASEDAVNRALAYLSRNQEPDGRWTFVLPGDKGPGRRSVYTHDMALTALAVLTFLGADHTPAKPGPYQAQLGKAMEYLLKNAGKNGDFRG